MRFKKVRCEPVRHQLNLVEKRKGWWIVARKKDTVLQGDHCTNVYPLRSPEEITEFWRNFNTEKRWKVDQRPRRPSPPVTSCETFGSVDMKPWQIRYCQHSEPRLDAMSSSMAKIFTVIDSKDCALKSLNVSTCFHTGSQKRCFDVESQHSTSRLHTSSWCCAVNDSIWVTMWTYVTTDYMSL